VEACFGCEAGMRVGVFDVVCAGWGLGGSDSGDGVGGREVHNMTAEGGGRVLFLERDYAVDRVRF
jgi:hypothetical protein